MSTRIVKRFAGDAVPAHIAFNYEDVEQRLNQYKAQVRADCQQEIQKATEEAERIRAKAQQDGHAEGYRHGLSQAESEVQKQAKEIADRMVSEELEPLLPTISQLLNGIAIEHSQRQAAIEAEVVELSLAIAEQIIRHELSVRPERIGAIIGHALRLVVGRPNFVLQMNPADVAALEHRLPEIIHEASEGVDVKVTTSDSVARGGCVVTTEHGRIDAQIETMLTRIRQELLDGT